MREKFIHDNAIENAIKLRAQAVWAECMGMPESAALMRQNADIILKWARENGEKRRKQK